MFKQKKKIKKIDPSIFSIVRFFFLVTKNIKIKKNKSSKSSFQKEGIDFIKIWNFCFGIRNMTCQLSQESLKYTNDYTKPSVILYSLQHIHIPSGG